MLIHHTDARFRRGRLSRRSFLRTAAASAAAMTFADRVALAAAELKRQNRSMILLWMNGGPSQFDTFSPAAGDLGGGIKPISTSVPGIQIAERLPNLAKVADDLCVIRSMTNKEGNHQRAQYQMHTGYPPSGSVAHPAFPSLAAEQLVESIEDRTELPSVVSIGRTTGAGFLGVDYEPFVVGDPSKMPANVATSVPENRVRDRLRLLEKLDGEFAKTGAERVVADHQSLYRQSADMVLSKDVSAFDVSKEPEKVRREYGDSDFGRGCLLARRLVETGVSCVEVRLDGWDTHDNADARLATLTGSLDPAYAALLSDLKRRGMLDRTLVVWAGEFGRTPRVNGRGGRDHFPRAFNVALAGCGVRGGRVVGGVSKDANMVEDRPVTVPDLLRTMSHALGIDADREHVSPLGRPMKVVDGGEVVTECFA